ncbi:hypothetical protein AVEN_11346-1 [Araneus ventricosus]|uniref:Uncharacterized protein n=1 Tax=Araneus ventricosus TaxID=182803 RepID=A0A4Y2HC63_ARAVE|nr:hypothetical protein AVEN_11346-1 [Araneus ventricosus]
MQRLMQSNQIFLSLLTPRFKGTRGLFCDCLRRFELPSDDEDGTFVFKLEYHTNVKMFVLTWSEVYLVLFNVHWYPKRGEFVVEPGFELGAFQFRN